MKLVDMSYDLSRVLVDIVPEFSVYENIRKGDEVIYLAETGIDLTTHRDTIRRELIRYGYKVLPDHHLPTENEKALTDHIRNDLKASNLSIHLIGEDYGKPVAETDKSLIDIQNRVATEYSTTKEAESKKGGFRRLIWISPHLGNISERQKIFIENLKSDAEALESAEIMQTSIHDLRTVLRNELIYKNRQTDHRTQIEETEGTSVYLIYDRQDSEASEKLQSILEKKGLNVFKSEFDQNLIDLRNQHLENLRRCDGSLIVYGNSNEEWVTTKIQDLLKSPGFGRSRPMKVNAILTREGREFNQDKLKRSNALVLYDKGEINENLLKPFLERLVN
jgi:hypothetical protein